MALSAARRRARLHRPPRTPPCTPPHMPAHTPPPHTPTLRKPSYDYLLRNPCTTIFAGAQHFHRRPFRVRDQDAHDAPPLLPARRPHLHRLHLPAVRPMLTLFTHTSHFFTHTSNISSSCTSTRGVSHAIHYFTHTSHFFTSSSHISSSCTSSSGAPH